MKWNVKWSAPEFPTTESPLEIQIVQAPTPPARVHIEVWESDAREFEVDDYDDQKLPEKEDDRVATFEGTLTPHSVRANGFVFADVDGKPDLAAEQGSDHVFLRFEGEPAGTHHECPIPASGREPNADSDGEFYELYFLVFDADAPSKSKPLVRSSVHFVRRRTDVLLAVEPLNQGTAFLNTPLGKQILERFHDGKSTTANRNWGDVLLQVRGEGTSVSIQSSGCSYTVMTMVARYLRTIKALPAEDTAPADIEWETLYDQTAGRTLTPASAPWETKKFKKIPQASAIEGLAKQLAADHAGEWRKKPKAADPATLTLAPSDDPQRPVSDLVVRRDTMPAHWFVPRMVWWVRHGDGNTNDPETNLRRGQMRWQTFPNGGGTEMLDMVDAGGKPIFRYGFPNETSNGYSRTKDALLFPPNKGLTPNLFSGLGIKFTHKNFAEPNPNWPDFVVKQLRRGLPVMAHWKSGRFLREGTDPGGHYTLIVGFRTVNGRRRFIINEPAGSKKLQYECLFEDELTPSEGEFDGFKDADIDVAILDPTRAGKAAILKEGSVSIGASDLDQAKSLELVDGDSHKHHFELKVRTDYWRESEFILGGLQVDLRYSEDDALQHTSDPVKVGLAQRSRNKKAGKASFAGSVEIDVSATRKIVLSIRPRVERTKGPLPRKPWEGHSNTLVERRRHDTMGGFTVFEPTAGWPKGAARFLPFDGRVAADA